MLHYKDYNTDPFFKGDEVLFNDETLITLIRTAPEKRELAVLERVLSTMSEQDQTVLYAAAVLRRFDGPSLDATAGGMPTTLMFYRLEELPICRKCERGRNWYYIHEYFRALILEKLYTDLPYTYKELNCAALNVFHRRYETDGGFFDLIEKMHHWLVADPREGASEYRKLVAEWSIWPTDVEKLFYLYRLGEEHIKAGRLDAPTQEAVRYCRNTIGRLQKPLKGTQ